MLQSHSGSQTQRNLARLKRAQKEFTQVRFLASIRIESPIVVIGIWAG